MKKVAWAACIAVLSTGAVAQTNVAQTQLDWPLYAGDLAGSRYKPLDQINASNFSRLEVAWRFKTDNIGNRPEFKLEGTPLEAGGVVYATAGSRRAVVALDATCGELLWVHG
jgi:quinoprotein glucose dehydrogenase